MGGNLTYIVTNNVSSSTKIARFSIFFAEKFPKDIRPRLEISVIKQSPPVKLL